jgi:phage host-nuclease inhibitor protein Gam
MLKDLGHKSVVVADKELHKLQTEATRLQAEYNEALAEVQGKYSE